MKYLFIVLAFLAFNSYGQSTGLYGKKTILEVQGHGCWPVFSGWLNSRTYYKKSGSGLKQGQNLFDGGVRFGISRAFSNMVGLGLEYGMEFQTLAANDYINLGYQYGSGTEIYMYPAEIRHEALAIRTTTIMPKLEFSGSGNLLPIGLSHQIGVGYSVTNLVDKDYRYILTNNNSDSLVVPPASPTVVTTQNFKGVTVMYQINMRTPITEQLMISYGFRYNANFVRSIPPTTAPPGKMDTAYIVKRKRNRSYVQLHIGAAFAF